MRQLLPLSCLLWICAAATNAAAQEPAKPQPGDPGVAKPAGVEASATEKAAAPTANAEVSGAATPAPATPPTTGVAAAGADAAPPPPAAAPPPPAAAPAAAPVDALAEPKPVVGDVSLHGYFRGGYGLSSEKGRMTCFQVQGALTKYRLGNECDQYGEFHFSAPIYVAKDGMVAVAHLMPHVWIPSTTLGHPQDNDIQPGDGQLWNGAHFGFPHMYMELKNIPGLAGGTAWVGQRYYKREDYHSTDFFYWNPSGLGAGIEDINLGGELRLSYGAFAVDSSPVNAANPAMAAMPPSRAVGVRNDVQLRGIRLYPSGELQIGLNVIANWTNKDASTDPAAAPPPDTRAGWSATVQHVQTLDSLSGKNKLALQYGQGAGVAFGTTNQLDTPSGTSRFRVVDVFTIDPADWFGLQAGFVFQHDKQNDAKQDWIS